MGVTLMQIELPHIALRSIHEIKYTFPNQIVLKLPIKQFAMKMKLQLWDEFRCDVLLAFQNAIGKLSLKTCVAECNWRVYLIERVGRNEYLRQFTRKDMDFESYFRHEDIL